MPALGPDVYVAQLEFFRADRKVVHCARLTSLHLDLYVPKEPRLRGCPLDLLVGLVDLTSARAQPTAVVAFWRSRRKETRGSSPSTLVAPKEPPWRTINGRRGVKSLQVKRKAPTLLRSRRRGFDDRSNPAAGLSESECLYARSFAGVGFRPAAFNALRSLARPCQLNT